MSERTSLRGELIEDETVVTLDELCRSCTVRSEEVITMVQEGIIDPTAESPDVSQVRRWRFHISSVRRVRAAVRLQRDLGVNLPGAALALELMDRIAELERGG